MSKKSSVKVIRKLLNYTPEHIDGLFKQLFEQSEFSGGTYVLKNIIEEEIDDFRFKQLFIHDLGHFFNEFFSFFKGIEDVPKKYHKILADSFAGTEGGRMHFSSPKYNGKFFRNCIFYARKKKYEQFIKFLDISISAVVNNKRRDLCVDGVQPGSKHTREHNLSNRK